MIGQRFPILDWPYKEGLRIDEAMHDLTIMVTGLYRKKTTKYKMGTPFRFNCSLGSMDLKATKAIVNNKIS